MSLSGFISTLMTREGLTTNQALADAVGVSRAMVGHWRRGVAVPGPRTRCALIARFSLDEVEAGRLRRLCDEVVVARVDAVA
jgi:transcriptional regulator with XRE-family HTH domain